MNIVPAIIPQSREHLDTSLSALSGTADAFQIDFVDGVFAGEPSWPFTEGGGAPEAAAALSDFAGRGEIEVDLMLEHPETFFAPLCAAGAARLVLHLKTLKPGDTFFFEKCETKVGIALQRDDAVETLAPYAPYIAFVQCMGIATIGVQGNPFDERVLQQIEAVRAAYPTLPVTVDGGVTMYTLPLLKAAGASRFVAGSAIFRAVDPVRAFTELQTLANA